MKKFSGSAISRHQVFTLADGSFVVQWDEKRVQDIHTGFYREFDYRRDFGHAITDWELKQLKSSGRVEHYNKNYVWLYSLPETGRYPGQKVLGRGERIRAYYLSTALPKSQLSNAEIVMKTVGLGEAFALRVRNNLVVVLDAGGKPFRALDEAEAAQILIDERAAELFTDLNVAFLELDPKALNRVFHEVEDPNALNLDELIASQRDTTITEGRVVVLVVKDEEEREAFSALFGDDMTMEVKVAENAREALELIEDHRPDLLVMDLQLPDMHGWQFLSKVKEIGLLRDLSILVVTDESHIGMSVVQVEYMVRPVSIARLRHNTWKMLHERLNTPRPSK